MRLSNGLQNHRPPTFTAATGRHTRRIRRRPRHTRRIRRRSQFTIAGFPALKALARLDGYAGAQIPRVFALVER